MIRKFEINEIDTIMRIWFETNTKAHDFIDKSYWKKNYEVVKAMMPNSIIFVYEDYNEIQGFVGLTGSYIAGIFINEDSQSKGIGKALIDYIKENHSELSLRVYKKNARAVNFYQREGFIKSNEQIDENTGELEFVMNWTR